MDLGSIKDLIRIDIAQTSHTNFWSKRADLMGFFDF